MIECTLLTLLLAGIILVSVLNRGSRSSSRSRTRPGRQIVQHRPARSRPARSRPARKNTSGRPDRQSSPNRAAGLSEAQVRAILERALGAVWEADQQRIRAQVREQERRVAARLRQGQRELDFAELRALHEKSRQTADLAYASLDAARATEQAISENIRKTRQAIEAAQSRGGRNVTAMRGALEALYLDRDVIRAHRDRYIQDVQRLNQETGNLRDSIGANCGAPGRRWHDALMKRTKARKEGRL
ncbi:hypothetical protein AB0G04_26570 [Actinoplanes sp. NPDC023801]|uniref:hypothetical protein n=1 Tax=Actinoplanes sp. NPDC023801 TaxID=3154595 RepID=UPI00340EA20B